MPSRDTENALDEFEMSRPTLSATVIGSPVSSPRRRVETPRHQGALAHVEQPAGRQIRACDIGRGQSPGLRRVERAQIDALRVWWTLDEEEEPSAIRKKLRKPVTELTRWFDVGDCGNAASG